jgi:formyl-CoA transferase
MVAGLTKRSTAGEPRACRSGLQSRWPVGGRGAAVSIAGRTNRYPPGSVSAPHLSKSHAKHGCLERARYRFSEEMSRIRNCDTILDGRFQIGNSIVGEAHMGKDTVPTNSFFRDARTDLNGPLHGVRVLEVASTWAGPRCAAMLGDYGADVVKVEQLGSPDVAHRLPPFLEEATPPVSFFDAAVNRNKRNIALNFKKPRGIEVFLHLAREADIIVQSHLPGRMDEWGCGYEQVREINPDIIYVSISGYGQYGPYCRRSGYDPGAQAMSGLMWLNGLGDGPPMKVPIYLSDELAGIHAAFAALAALRHRDQHGEGQHVDVSLLDATVASCTGQPTLAAQGLPTPRLGNLYPFGAPANVYPCADGWVYAGVLLDTHWVRLVELLGRPELATHPDYATIPGRVARRLELDQMMAEFCEARTRDQVIDAIAGIGLAVAKVLTPGEMVQDQHVQARDTIQSARLPSGAIVQTEGPPAKMSRTPVRVRFGAAPHGWHTEEVLEAAGFDEGERAMLRDDGII